MYFIYFLLSPFKSIQEISAFLFPQVREKFLLLPSGGRDSRVLVFLHCKVGRGQGNPRKASFGGWGGGSLSRWLSGHVPISGCTTPSGEEGLPGASSLHRPHPWPWAFYPPDFTLPTAHTHTLNPQSRQSGGCLHPQHSPGDRELAPVLWLATVTPGHFHQRSRSQDFLSPSHLPPSHLGFPISPGRGKKAHTPQRPSPRTHRWQGRG